MGTRLSGSRLCIPRLEGPAVAIAVKGPYAVRKANSDGSPPVRTSGFARSRRGIDRWRVIVGWRGRATGDISLQLAGY